MSITFRRPQRHIDARRKRRRQEKDRERRDEEDCRRDQSKQRELPPVRNLMQPRSSFSVEASVHARCRRRLELLAFRVQSCTSSRYARHTSYPVPSPRTWPSSSQITRSKSWMFSSSCVDNMICATALASLTSSSSRHREG